MTVYSHPPEKVLGEVKNTANLSFTKQLQDYFGYANKNDMKVNLFTKEGTKFSQNLLGAVRDNGGKIDRQVRGKWVDVTKKLLDTLPKKQ